MTLNENYTNSKLECVICMKKISKNYMLTHLKTRHSNCYGTPYWDKYSERYKKIIEDNKKLFEHVKE
mgnify:CR=1 FL=1